MIVRTEIDPALAGPPKLSVPRSPVKLPRSPGPIPPFPRAELTSPALIIDLFALERNIASMARWSVAQNISLRPHAKTHKSGEIARRQVAAGAVGICCAKLGEAEALAEEGIDDILITSPVV